MEMRTPRLCGMEANLDFKTSRPLLFKREWKKTEAVSLETKDFYFRTGNIFSSERKGAEQCQELVDTGEMGFTEGAQPQVPSAFSSPGEGPVAQCQCWGPGAPSPPACEPEAEEGGVFSFLSLTLSCLLLPSPEISPCWLLPGPYVHGNLSFHVSP